jgi:hypothetical protein
MKYMTAGMPFGKCTRVYEMTKEGKDALRQQVNSDILCGQLSLDIDDDSWHQNYETMLYWNWKSMPKSEREIYGRPYRIG